MNHHIPRESWKSVRSFFQGHPEMLAILEQLACQGFYDRFWASTSHFALGISPVETYQERLVHPMVYVEVSMTKDSANFHFQNGQGNSVYNRSIQLDAVGKIWKEVADFLHTQISEESRSSDPF